MATFSELRTRIGEIDAMLKAGEGIEGYTDCVYKSLLRERHYRDWTGPYTYEATIDSGAAAGTKLYREPSAEVSNPQYNIYSVSGPDADYFQTVVRDNDKISHNGYYYDHATDRPLPAGAYTVNFHQQHHSYVVCNFNPTHNNYVTYEVTVQAPAGTLHEAFFDPAGCGNGRRVHCRVHSGRYIHGDCWPGVGQQPGRTDP